MMRAKRKTYGASCIVCHSDQSEQLYDDRPQNFEDESPMLDLFNSFDDGIHILVTMSNGF